MLDKQMTKLKNMFKNTEGNNKKKIENMVVFVIILIITIIAINAILNDSKKNDNIQNINTTKTLAQSEKSNKLLNDEDDLKSKLEEILSKINGVGDVRVLITYSQSGQSIALYNEDNSKRRSVFIWLMKVIVLLAHI